MKISYNKDNFIKLRFDWVQFLRTSSPDNVRKLLVAPEQEWNVFGSRYNSFEEYLSYCEAGDFFLFSKNWLFNQKLNKVMNHDDTFDSL